MKSVMKVKSCVNPWFAGRESGGRDKAEDAIYGCTCRDVKLRGKGFARYARIHTRYV
jgi:hypothetical protein